MVDSWAFGSWTQSFQSRMLSLDQAKWQYRRSQDFLIGGGPNHRSNAMTSSVIFKKELFVGQRYRRTEDLKP